MLRLLLVVGKRVECWECFSMLTLRKIQKWAHSGSVCPTLAVIAPVEPIVNLDEWGVFA